MEINLNEFPWATFVTVAVTLIVAVTGGIVVIWGNPGALSFSDYVKTLEGMAVANGLLGVGRGIRANGKFKSHR